MSLLYRAVLGVGICVLFGASHVATAEAITWNFGGDGKLGAKGSPLIFGSGDNTVTATAWNYRPPVGSTSYSFQAARLFQTNSGEGGLGVCADIEVTACNQNLSADYQVDNAWHDDYVLFVFSAPMDQFTVRIDPDINKSIGWDLDVSYWVGHVNDPFSFDLQGKEYSYLTGLGFSYGYSNGDPQGDYGRDVSIVAPTPVNVLLFGPKLGGEGDGSDRFKVTSISSVPEPSSMLLLALGMGIIGLTSMRRNLVKG